ncbi:hypothetical protein [Rhizobium sp. 11515TR]|uniref:hypothetical protein n=1 Tax=unclassified Rhizobium TaxID=2613769 RepID=UPI000BA8806E|nr:hypothetical protein [Rhizobium sp. 11515TR]ASW10226.1 hypothetical protein CKA34_30125 [Rhizobium sp. 11515TR]
MFVHLGDFQIEDDGRYHIEIGTIDRAHAFKRKSDYRVLVEDEVALGIHLVRHIPDVNAQQPGTVTGEGDLKQFGIMEAGHTPEPLKQRLPPGMSCRIELERMIFSPNRFGIPKSAEL